MIKCPNAECGYENVDGTQFCEGCGEELPQAAANAPAATSSASGAGGANVTGNMVKCPACDNLNAPENVVCEVCGTELKASGGTPATAAPDAANVQTAPPMTSPSAVPATDPNASTTSTATTAGAPQSPFDSAASPSGASTAGAPAGSGTATPPASAMNAALSTDATLTTAPTASAPDIDIAGVGGSADAMTPVVAGGAVTSGVTTPDTFATQSTPVAADPISTSPVAADPFAPAPVAAAPVSADPAAPATTTSGGGEMAPGKVKLVVEQGLTIGKQFVLGDAEILVGREDEDEQIYPDIDLSDQDEGFVHRRHAQLKFENGALSVMHLGGANKTRLNNKPLPDNEAQAVKIGDKISFGKVVTRVAAA